MIYAIFENTGKMRICVSYNQGCISRSVFRKYCTVTVFENYTTPFYLEMQNVLQPVLIIKSDHLRVGSRLVWDVTIKFYIEDGF